MRRRTTDFGTAILHASLVATFLVLLPTGLRISTDDPDRTWVRMLDPVLPVEDLWLRHSIAGLAMTAVMGAYAIYLVRARLVARVRLDAVRLVAILRPGAQRWSALNIVVYWILVTSLVVEIVTGLLLFTGASQILLWVHRDATFVCIGAIVGHVGLHSASGGIAQLTRVLLPARLDIGPPPPDFAELLAEQLARQSGMPGAVSNRAAEPRSASRRRPLIAAALIATVTVGGALAAERITRPVLRIAAIAPAQAPRLDGDLSDPAWRRAPPVSVLTTQGGDFGGTYQSTVEIRALHDGEVVYFAFTWEDPTRSLKHLPLVKTDGAWRVVASSEDLSDEHTFHEDKFAVLLAPPGLPLIGAAIHLARQPIRSKPPARSGRGLHFTDGTFIDVWQWRASHNHGGHIDHCHFGGPDEPADDATAGERPYSGGFRIDPGDVPYTSNIANSGQRDIRPKRLPRDAAATTRALGHISNGHDVSEDEASRWFMLEGESTAYSAELDARIPNGTVVPGILFVDRPNSRPDSVVGVARWAAGRWTLELARRRRTGSPRDVPIETGTLLWVAAFDHAEKRHTRHLRPLTLEIE